MHGWLWDFPWDGKLSVVFMAFTVESFVIKVARFRDLCRMEKVGIILSSNTLGHETLIIATFPTEKAPMDDPHTEMYLHYDR